MGPMVDEGTPSQATEHGRKRHTWEDDDRFEGRRSESGARQFITTFEGLAVAQEMVFCFLGSRIRDFEVGDLLAKIDQSELKALRLRLYDSMALLELRQLQEELDHYINKKEELYNDTDCGGMDLDYNTIEPLEPLEPGLEPGPEQAPQPAPQPVLQPQSDQKDYQELDGVVRFLIEDNGQVRWWPSAIQSNGQPVNALLTRYLEPGESIEDVSKRLRGIHQHHPTPYQPIPQPMLHLVAQPLPNFIPPNFLPPNFPPYQFYQPPPNLPPQQLFFQPPPPPLHPIAPPSLGFDVIDNTTIRPRRRRIRERLNGSILTAPLPEVSDDLKSTESVDVIIECLTFNTAAREHGQNVAVALKWKRSFKEDCKSLESHFVDGKRFNSIALIRQLAFVNYNMAQDVVLCVLKNNKNSKDSDIRYLHYGCNHCGVELFGIRCHMFDPLTGNSIYTLNTKPNKSGLHICNPDHIFDKETLKIQEKYKQKKRQLLKSKNSTQSIANVEAEEEKELTLFEKEWQRIEEQVQTIPMGKPTEKIFKLYASTRTGGKTIWSLLVSNIVEILLVHFQHEAVPLWGKQPEDDSVNELTLIVEDLVFSVYGFNDEWVIGELNEAGFNASYEELKTSHHHTIRRLVKEHELIHMGKVLLSN